MRERLLRGFLAALLLGALSFATVGPAGAASVTPPKYVHAMCNDFVGWTMDMVAPTTALKEASTVTSATDRKAQSIAAFGSGIAMTNALIKRLTALGTPTGKGGRKFATYWIDYFTQQRDSFSKTRDGIAALASTDDAVFKQQYSALVTTQAGELAKATEQWKAAGLVAAHAAPDLNAAFNKDKACKTFASLGGA